MPVALIGRDSYRAALALRDLSDEDRAQQKLPVLGQALRRQARQAKLQQDDEHRANSGSKQRPSAADDHRDHG